MSTHTSDYLSDRSYNARWIERAKSRCVVSPTGCWLWQGCLTETGYSLIGYRSINRGGHRLMYKVYYGVQLETEQYVLHRCDVRNCINPEHLWIGTAKDNNNDCAGKGRHYEGTKLVCDHGHPLIGDNVRISKQHLPKTGIRRVCRACERARFATPEYKAQTAERARRRRQAKRLGEQHVG